MKKIRRTLITILIIILIPSILMAIPGVHKQYSKDATKIKVNKIMKIENDRLIINSIVFDDDYTYINYSLLRKYPGCNFPSGLIKIYDDKGNEITNNGGNCSSKTWGQQGIMVLEKFSLKEVDSLLLKFQLFDIESELLIDLKKAGGMGEKE